ncbi:hypothetical protein C6503_01270 [Candidatus Poribacteria bacterium]|nr:MAG: hypothetical protein C6503_01270 [Candidatus Poribacteria bacterium]
MKHDIRSKISDFLKSEEGRVGAKSPLALGVASASVLLAQMMATPSAQAHMECAPGSCPEGEYCVAQCDGTWRLGTCIGTVHSHCESL